MAVPLLDFLSTLDLVRLAVRIFSFQHDERVFLLFQTIDKDGRHPNDSISSVGMISGTASTNGNAMIATFSLQYLVSFVV